MNRQGFTLVELLVVISIMGLLTALGTFQFSSYVKKSGMTSQTRALYGDLNEYRMKSFYEKRNWTFKISSDRYEIFSSSDVTVPPVKTVALKHPVTTADFTANVVFDQQGGSNVSGKTVCIASSNDAVVDSVIISATRVQIGKKKEGSCQSDNITAK